MFQEDRCQPPTRQYSSGRQIWSDHSVLGLKHPTPSTSVGQQLRPLDAPPALLYHAQKPLQRTRHHSTPSFSSSDDSEHKSPLKKYKYVATETCSTKSLNTKITRLYTLDGNCSAKNTVASLNSARNADGTIDLTDAPGNTLCPIHAPASAPSLQRLYEVMEASIASQELLEEWDMQQGLPKSHSWTMMHSNRSRRQLLEGRILPKWNGKPLIGGGDVKANPTNSSRYQTKSRCTNETHQQQK